METLKTKADIENLDEVTEFIDEQLEEAGCSIEIVMSVELSVEEMFTNVASYAYRDGQGFVEISVEHLLDPERMIIIMADSGQRFDPLEKTDPDTSDTLRNDVIGGLGIYVVKKQMDRVSYKYENGQNILTMEKLVRK